jgi:hypothetical protein
LRTGGPCVRAQFSFLAIAQYGFKSAEAAAAKPEGRLPMNGFKTFLFIAICCAVASTALADIYEWTDADGVRHYSNYAPPENSRILMKTKEEPYDEEADRARAEAERQAQLEMTRLDIAQREAELELREAEAARKMAEADRLAEEAQRDAESYAEEFENSRTTFQSYGYGCYGYYNGCGDPIYGRTYYRNDTASIFFKKPPYATRYRHFRSTKPHGSHYSNDDRNKFRVETFYRPGAYHKNHYRQSRGGGIAGAGRLGPRGGGNNGHGGFSGRGSGIGWRR